MKIDRFQLLLGLVFVAATFYSVPVHAVTNTAPFQCDIDYSSGSPTDFNTLVGQGCVPTAADEPIDGKLCFDAGFVIREASDIAVAVCVERGQLESTATTTFNNNWKGFNALRDTIDRTCRSSDYCHDGGPSATCILGTPGDPNSCTAKNRHKECDTSCSGCITNYTYCGDAGNVCQLNYIGPGLREGNVADDGTFDTEFSCESIGRDADACTGQCSTCPTGKTPSGDPQEAGSCVTYAKRFEQIFEMGLTSLGGPFSDVDALNSNAFGLYDYTVTAPVSYAALVGTNVEHYIQAMEDVFFKVDVSETLNWSSSTLPPAIQNLLTGNGENSYILCDGTSVGLGSAAADAACPDGMVCSEGGLCYAPGGFVGRSCADEGVSECQLGLTCTNGICTDPNNPNGELVSCTTTLDCAGQPFGATSCMNGYCRNPNNTAGDSCALSGGSDAECSAGLVCGPGNICTESGLFPFPGGAATFVGITAVKFTAPLAGYAAADALCDGEFGGSHVCTMDEVLGMYARQSSSLPASGTGWLNGGSPGYVANANDCQAWTRTAEIGEEGINYGRYWDFAADQGWMRFCTDPNLGFACCQ